MTIEDQVCNLELARRLKELGVEQESCFYWINTGIDTEDYVVTDHNNAHDTHNGETDSWMAEPETCSAFTVAELGEMLINEYTVVAGRVKDSQDIVRMALLESVTGSSAKLNKIKVGEFDSPTEADARAKLVITHCAR